MQTIIEAVKHIWGKDSVIDGICSAAIVLFCMGISGWIIREGYDEIYNPDNDYVRALLRKKPIHDKRVYQYYKKVTTFSDAIVVGWSLFVYFIVMISYVLSNKEQSIYFCVMYTAMIPMGVVLFSRRRVRRYNQYLERSILMEGTITEVWPKAEYNLNGLQIEADYVFTDPDGKEHNCTEVVEMFLLGFPYQRQFEKWKKLYYPGKRVHILVNAYEYKLSYLPMQEDYCRAYKKHRWLYLLQGEYLARGWRERKEDSDIEVDWSDFDMANYPKEDPYTLMFRANDSRSVYDGIRVGKLYFFPMHPTTKLQWVFVIGFYTALSALTFFMEAYLPFCFFVIVLIVYITIMPLIMRGGQKLYEKVCREQYKADYIKKIKSDNDIAFRQERIRRYALSNGLEKPIHSAMDLGLQTMLNQASKWYMELGYDLGDIILLKSINGQSLCNMETEQARGAGLPEGYYVIAVKDTYWLCCTKEEERVYAFSKPLGLTHTKYGSLYDYIIDICGITG